MSMSANARSEQPASGPLPGEGAGPVPSLDTETLRALFHKSWSRRTSTLWTAGTPSRGQCGVTALVVNDYFGGEILKTPVGAAWHFYNRVGGRVLDLTADQFSGTIEYAHIPSSREEAFADTSRPQYSELARRFARCLREYTRS